MHEIELSVPVERPAKEAGEVFAGDVYRWLPVTVGPDERSWRAETAEGPVCIELEVEAGSVFVHPDGIRWRRFSVRPDRTSRRNLVTALLTPAVEGHLGLSGHEPTGSILRFEGRTRRRTWLTGVVGRWVVGDPLAASGIETLLQAIAHRLEVADPTGSDRTTTGRVRCQVPQA